MWEFAVFCWRLCCTVSYCSLTVNCCRFLALTVNYCESHSTLRLSGKSAARDSARDAARDAARDSARDTARDLARDTAR